MGMLIESNESLRKLYFLSLIEISSYTQILFSFAEANEIMFTIGLV